jgi:hypothetical protein
VIRCGSIVDDDIKNQVLPSFTLDPPWHFWCRDIQGVVMEIMATIF